MTSMSLKSQISVWAIMGVGMLAAVGCSGNKTILSPDDFGQDLPQFPQIKPEQGGDRLPSESVFTSGFSPIDAFNLSADKATSAIAPTDPILGEVVKPGSPQKVIATTMVFGNNSNPIFGTDDLAAILKPNGAIASIILSIMPDLDPCATAEAITDQGSSSFDRTSREILHRYFYHSLDLNGDQQPETLVHVVGPMTCGTGGCTSLILSNQNLDDTEYQMVSQLSLVNSSMIVSDRTTNGWADLLVQVSGGGAPTVYHRLQFNGQTYPSNPSLAPVVTNDMAQNEAAQGTVLAMDDTFSLDKAAVVPTQSCNAAYGN